jgi:hypothetical protein
MTNRIVIAKAQPIGDQAVLDVIIKITGQLPYHPELADQAAFMDGQAVKLEAALHGSLPGGTYDRLLATMLERKAGHLRVSWEQPPQEPTVVEQALAACRIGDYLGNDGSYLLYTAAEMLDNIAPVTAEELRRKAHAEHEVIGAADRACQPPLALAQVGG